MEKNKQQPVAWTNSWADANGQRQYEIKWLCDPLAGELLYLSPPVPRDVLMAAAEEVQAAVKNAARAEYSDRTREDEVVYDEVDLAAIADRYASKVQPEPVNPQLLAALKPFAADNLAGVSAVVDGKTVVIHCADYFQNARAAIAAAEAAQPVGPRECGCGWRGESADCVWCGNVGPLCPKCHETTEEAQQPASAQPVAWCELNGKGEIAYFDGKPIFMPGAVGNECHPVPLFAAQPVSVPDAEIIQCFETEMAHNPAAYDQPGEVVYQITQKELVRAARAMLSAAQKPEGV